MSAQFLFDCYSGVCFPKNCSNWKFKGIFLVTETHHWSIRHRLLIKRFLAKTIRNGRKREKVRVSLDKKNRYFARSLQVTLQNVARKCKKCISLAKFLSRNTLLLQEASKKIHYLCKKLARNKPLLQESCTKQMNLAKILQELCYSCHKKCRFFIFLQRTIHSCGNKGFKSLALQVVLWSKNILIIKNMSHSSKRSSQVSQVWKSNKFVKESKITVFDVFDLLILLLMDCRHRWLSREKNLFPQFFGTTSL